MIKLQSFRKLHHLYLQLLITLLFRTNKKITFDTIMDKKSKLLMANQKNKDIYYFLQDSGYTNSIYLKRKKDHFPQSFEYDTAEQLGQNNADVLIISGKAVREINTYRHYRQTAYILLEISHLYSLLTIFPGYLKNSKLKRISYIGTIESPLNQTYLVFKNLKRKKNATRKYISPELGIESFFKNLNQMNMNYVILRWFETLPNLLAGEDIDILVANEDAEKLSKLMDQKIGTIPCDTYTVTGIPGFDYKQISYFTPRFAKDILDSAIIWKDIYRIPNPEMHIDSMAYHALYHKGINSGLPSVYYPQKKLRPEHDYESILLELTRNNNMILPISMERLHEHLISKGYQPPLDTLYRLSFENDWVARIIQKEMDTPIKEKNVTLFILREAALNFHLSDKIIHEIENEGFTIIEDYLLSEEEKITFSNNTRGGNWERGPYPESGGYAARVIIAIDLAPIEMNFTSRIQYPGLQNQRVMCKKNIRDKMNQQLTPEQTCNMLHSSDNDVEAWYYLNLLFTEKEINNIVEKIKREETTFQTKETILKSLSRNGRRAKVELVSWKNKKVVKKTYKPQSLRFLEREVEALALLEDKFDEVPEILERGDNYLIYPYYQDQLKWRKSSFRLIPVKDAKKMIHFLEKLYEEGYAFIDFHPMNVLYDKNYGLKVIDYEFLYKYKEKPSSFLLSYDIAGIPETFESDAPLQEHTGYDFNLKPYIGVDIEALLNDTNWQLHIQRFYYFFNKKIPLTIKHNAVNHIRGLKWSLKKDTKLYKLITRVMQSEMLKKRFH